MYDDNWPLEKKLNFWVEKPAMYFVPDLPPNLEAAVVRVIRQELARAKAEEAFNRRFNRPWWRRWLNR
jgi:hypothetical protein